MAIVDNAGETMVEETGEINVKDDTNKVATHFLERVQLSGFAGSSGPFQVT